MYSPLIPFVVSGGPTSPSSCFCCCCSPSALYHHTRPIEGPHGTVRGAVVVAAFNHSRRNKKPVHLRFCRHAAFAASSERTAGVEASHVVGCCAPTYDDMGAKDQPEASGGAGSAAGILDRSANTRDGGSGGEVGGTSTSALFEQQTTGRGDGDGLRDRATVRPRKRLNQMNAQKHQRTHCHLRYTLASCPLANPRRDRSPRMSTNEESPSLFFPPCMHRT